MSRKPENRVTLNVNPTLLACARMAAFQRRITTVRLLAEVIEAYIAGERLEGRLPQRGVSAEFRNPVDFAPHNDDDEEEQEREAVQ